MNKVHKSVLVPYPIEKMYELVERVEDYPQFLPWCAGVHIREQSANQLVATLQIAFKGVRQSFTTRNIHTPPHSMKMYFVEGPFKKLEGTWEFIELDQQACKIEFNLEYGFSNIVLEKLIGPMFNMIANTFIDGFVQRAEELYGHH